MTEQAREKVAEKPVDVGAQLQADKESQSWERNPAVGGKLLENEPVLRQELG